ncbi:MAG: hypothetical protein AMXMBFR58_36660 [Phycisphaerae bacterium]
MNSNGNNGSEINNFISGGIKMDDKNHANTTDLDRDFTTNVELAALHLEKASSLLRAGSSREPTTFRVPENALANATPLGAKNLGSTVCRAAPTATAAPPTCRTHTSADAPTFVGDAAELVAVVLLERGYAYNTASAFLSALRALDNVQPVFDLLRATHMRFRLEESTSPRHQETIFQYYRLFIQVAAEQGWWIGRDPTRYVETKNLRVAARRTRRCLSAETKANLKAMRGAA